MNFLSRLLMFLFSIHLPWISASAQDEAFEYIPSSSNKSAFILDIAVADALEDPLFGSIVSAVTMMAPPEETLKFEEIQKIRRVTVFVGGQSQQYGPPEFVTRIRVNDKKLLPRIANTVNPWMEKEFHEEDGWMVYKGMGEGITIRYKDDVFEMGTSYFCSSSPRAIVSEEAFKQFSNLDKKSVVRAVVDAPVLSNIFRTFLNSEFANEQSFEDAFSGENFLSESAFLNYGMKLLDEIKSVNFTIEAGSEQLIKIAIVPKKNKVESVHAKAMVLMDLVRFHLDVPTQFLKQHNSPIGDLLDGIAKGLEFKKNPESSELILNKPKNLVRLVAKLITGTQMKASDRRNLETLQQTAVAVHNFHDSFRRFPFPHPDLKPVDDSMDADLSWRVHLLPFCERQKEYEKLDLTKGWDAEENQAVAKKSKKQFVLSDGSLICGITGEKPSKTFGSIIDGSSNTIMLIANPNVTMTPWTKPFDLEIDDAIQLVMNLKEGEQLWVAMYDGSVGKIGSPKTSGATKRDIRILMDPQDGKAARRQLIVDPRPQLIPPLPNVDRRMSEKRDMPKAAVEAVDEAKFDIEEKK